jgi:hypothetical protein
MSTTWNGTHGMSIEREIGLAKKEWKTLKEAKASEEEINAAKEIYKTLKTKGITQQATKPKATKLNTTKYEKALRKKLKNIEMLKLKVARWTTQKPNAEQQEKISREAGLIQELVKLTKMPYVPSGITADGKISTAPKSSTSSGKNDVDKDYCHRFQVGKCPDGHNCPHVHEIRPKKSKTVIVASGKKRKFDDVSDDDGGGGDDGVESDANSLESLKAKWKQLKKDGANEDVIKAAKKKYKSAK